MAEPTLEEFRQLVGEPVSSDTNVPVAAISIAPATQAALDASSRRLAASRIEPAEPTSVFQTPDFATKMGARPGVPFDSTSGISFMSRLRAAAQPTPAEEEKALKAAYGDDKVRRNQFGYLVVTKPGPDGKPVDTLADPIGLDIGDAAALIGELPKIVGAAFGSAGASKLPIAPGFWKSLAGLIGMAGGGAAAGGSQDVITRLLEGGDIQPSEIAGRRGEGALADVAIGGALGAGTKAAALAVSPLAGSVGAQQTKSRIAQAALKSKHGVEIVLTPAERTGNAFLGRAEAMEMNKPGSQSVFQGIMREREDAVSKLRNIITGGPVPDDEIAGQRALAALGAKVAPLEQDVARATSALESTAGAELSAGTGLMANKAKVGEAIRTGAKSLKADFDATNAANYDAFFNNPLAKAPVISGSGLKQEVDSLLRDLPKVQKTVQQPTGVLGPNGQPLTVTAQVDVPVGTPVRPRLEELSEKLSNSKVSINDLKQIRTDVDNAIKTGEAVPGVKEGRLKSLYSKLTGAIDQGLQSINDPQLTAAWRNANDFYKANVGKFERAGINELFRDPSNALTAEEIVDRAVTSPGAYRAYKEFFGAGSPQIQDVQQAVRDSVLSRSTLSPVIDAKGFVTRIEALDKASPEALNDAFGSTAPKLRASARALQVAQGDTLPEKELIEAINSGNASATRLQQLISSQNAQKDAYANEIVRKVGEGNLKGDKIKPTEFVDYLVFRNKTQPKDLSSAMALLHDRPEVVEDIRRLTFNRILDDATVTSPSGTRVINAQKLEESLADENMVKRLKTTLGSSTFEDLTALKDVLKPSATVHKAAMTAGAFGGGAQTTEIVEHGSWAYVDRAIKNFVIAYAYTAPWMRQYLGNRVVPTAVANEAVNVMIASTPFLEALGKQFGARAERAAQQLNTVAGSQSATPANGAVPPSRDEFIRAISEGTPNRP